MKHTWKSRICSLLAAALCVCSVPAASFAAEGSGTASGSTASGGTITVAVTMEKHTLGQGFLIEPTLVKVPAETKASVVITDLLKKKYPDMETPYRMTGSVDSGFYLSAVYDPNQKDPQIPQYILDKVGKDSINYESAKDDYLGEFDYYTMSGWMYSVGTKEQKASFPGVGAADWPMKDGEIMRWQFTLYGYGADLNADNSAWGQESITPAGDKGSLVWAVAELNGKYSKESLMKQDTYVKAMNALKDPVIKQADLDAAVKALDESKMSGLEAKKEEAPAVTPAKGFTDVQKDDWYYEPVTYLTENSLAKGTSATAFSPDAPITRAEFVQLLYNKYGGSAAASPSAFTDVKDGDWYAKAVSWAASQGIVSGSKAKDGTALFNPNENISRQDMAVIIDACITKVAKKELKAEAAKMSFADSGSIADYAKAAVETMQTGGIISGTKSGDGFSFKPMDNATRAEASSMLAKLFRK